MTDQQAMEKKPTKNLRDAPKALWVGLIVGLVGFVVKFWIGSSSSVNGVVTSCTYIDFAALVVAVVCLACGITAAVQTLRRPGRYPFMPWLVQLLSAVLVVLSVIHALRGLGLIAGPC